MDKRILLCFLLFSIMALSGCGSSSSDSTEIDNIETTPDDKVVEDPVEPLIVYADQNWDVSADNFEDLSLVTGSADFLAVKRTGKTGNDDYTLLISSEPSKELTVHQSLSVNDYYSSQIRTAGFKFANSNAQEDVMVVTCTPGDVYQDGTSAYITPATLSFSLKSDPTTTESVNLNVIDSDYENVITCEAMDIYYDTATPDEWVLFVSGKHGYVNRASAFPVVESQMAISRLPIKFDKDGELSDNDPAVDEMIAFDKIDGELLTNSNPAYQILALSALSSDDVLYYQTRGSNNNLWLFEYGNTAPNIIVNSKTNAFTGVEETMNISDMQAHTSFGNIKQVSLVSHDHVGTITVDYESTTPAFTLSTDDDAKKCVDVITADAEDSATLWCHNSEDEGKLLEFSY